VNSSATQIWVATHRLGYVAVCLLVTEFDWTSLCKVANGADVLRNSGQSLESAIIIFRKTENAGFKKIYSNLLFNGYQGLPPRGPGVRRWPLMSIQRQNEDSVQLNLCSPTWIQDVQRNLWRLHSCNPRTFSELHNVINNADSHCIDDDLLSPDHHCSSDGPHPL